MSGQLTPRDFPPGVFARGELSAKTQAPAAPALFDDARRAVLRDLREGQYGQRTGGRPE